jgi:hypothetical protein
MRGHIARVVAVIGLTLASMALADEAPLPPPRPRPPASQPRPPATSPASRTSTGAWGPASGIMLGVGAAALATAGGLYLLRRRTD